MIARWQLLALGFTRSAIDHRVKTGRLHPVYRGVYAVGTPTLTPRGRWMAAVLVSGPEAMLSHSSAAALLEIGPELPDLIEVSIPARAVSRRPGIAVHRRTPHVLAERTSRHGIPVSSAVLTLLDLATKWPTARLERAINEADKGDHVSPEALRAALDRWAGHSGVRPLRKLLDRRTFCLTDSELERLFLPIARDAGLPKPETRTLVNGFRVDFFWPDLGLVVETDGLRYHRTPSQQTRDRIRDQAHFAAGLKPVRFTHAQVRFERDYVRRNLAAVARILQAERRG